MGFLKNGALMAEQQIFPIKKYNKYVVNMQTLTYHGQETERLLIGIISLREKYV